MRSSSYLSTNSVNIQHFHAMLVIVQDCQSIFHSKLVQYSVTYQNLHVSNSSLSTSNYEQNTISYTKLLYVTQQITVTKLFFFFAISIAVRNFSTLNYHTLVSSCTRHVVIPDCRKLKSMTLA